jgi:hypothetical protein
MARKARVEFAGAFTDRDHVGEQIYRRERKDRERVGIKKRTGVSLRWIGELVMGNDSHLSRLCSRIDDLANQPQLSKYLTWAIAVQ